MRKNLGRRNTLKKVTIKGMLPVSLHCSTIDLFQETQLKQFQSLLVSFRFILKNHLEMRALRSAVLTFKSETDFRRGMAELKDLMQDLFRLEERLTEQLNTMDNKLQTVSRSSLNFSNTKDRFFRHLFTFIGTISLQSSLSFSQEVQQALDRLSSSSVVPGDLQCLMQAVVRYSIQQKEGMLNLVNSQAGVLNLSMVFCDQIAEVEAQLQKSQILNIIRKIGKEVAESDLQQFDCLLNNKLIQKLYLREQLQRNLPAQACRLQYHRNYYKNQEDVEQHYRFKSRLKEEISRISLSSKKTIGKLDQKLSSHKQIDKRRSMISLMRSQKNVQFSDEEVNIMPTLLSKVSLRMETLSNIQSRREISDQAINYWEAETKNMKQSKVYKPSIHSKKPTQPLQKKSAITLLWNRRRKFIMPCKKAPAAEHKSAINTKSEGNEDGWNLIDWRLGRYLQLHREKHFTLQGMGRLSYYS